MYILMILITIFLVFLILGLNYYCSFKSNVTSFNFFYNHKKLANIIRIIFCTILLCLYFGIRWIPSLINTIQYDLINYHISEFRSANLSILFMLDLCSMLGWLLPFLCIFDWKKQRVLKPIALLSVIGGLATIFFTIPELYTSWDIKKFFIGTFDIGISHSDEPLMFIMHLWMVGIGFYIITKNNYFNRYNILFLSIYIVLYISYILSISLPLNIESHVSGLAYGDIFKMSEEYYLFNNLLYETIPSYGLMSILNLNHPWSSALLWVGIILIIILSVAFKNTSNFLIQNKILKYKFIPY